MKYRLYEINKNDPYKCDPIEGYENLSEWLAKRLCALLSAQPSRKGRAVIGMNTFDLKETASHSFFYRDGYKFLETKYA